jgi:hypothetical protein
MAVQWLALAAEGEGSAPGGAGCSPSSAGMLEF